MKKLNLYFPQWQGSGTTSEIYKGAIAIKSKLLGKINFMEIEQPPDEKLETSLNVIGYQRILSNLERAKAIIEENKPDKVFTLGGDCGIEVAPVTYLNQHYGSDLLVLWIDAHGDLNTPESSPSKTFHGMPLRMILGEGDSVLMKKAFSVLEPSQVILAGVRDLDQPEEQYIQENNITLMGVKVFEFDNLFQIIKAKNKQNIYVHLDLDVIDPMEFPDVKCPTANGVSLKKLKNVAANLTKNFNVVGGSVVEYTPKTDSVDENVLELLETIFL